MPFAPPLSAPPRKDVLELLSWNPDTEEARIAIVKKAGAIPDGINGYVAVLVVRSEDDAREMVRRWNLYSELIS